MNTTLLNIFKSHAQTEQCKFKAAVTKYLEIYNFTGRGGRKRLFAQFTHSLTPSFTKDPLKRTGGCFMHRPPLAVGRFLRGVDKKQGGMEREGSSGGREATRDNGLTYRPVIATVLLHQLWPPSPPNTQYVVAHLSRPVYASSPGFFRRKLSWAVVDSMKPSRYPLLFPPPSSRRNMKNGTRGTWHSNVIQRDIYRSSRQPTS